MANEPCVFCEIVAGRASATVLERWTNEATPEDIKVRGNDG
jgi:hypothetical protein